MDSYSQFRTPREISLMEEYALAGVISRADVYQQAEKTSYNAGDEIRIFFPLITADMREHTFQFSIDGTSFGSPATVTRLSQGAYCIFDRLDIYFGPKLVTSIERINILKNIIRFATPVNYTEGLGAQLEGTAASVVTRNNDFTDANRKYAINFNIGLLKRVLYLNKINLQLIIKLRLAQPNTCLETDNATGTQGTYTVTNPEFHYSTLVMSPQWNTKYNNLVSAEGGYKYTFKTFEHFENNTALLAGSTGGQVSLPFRYNSLLYILYVMRTAGSIDDATVNGKLSTFNFNNVSSSRFKIDTSYFPTDAARSLQDMLTQYLDTIGKSYYSDILAATNYGTTSFINGTPFMKHPKDNRDIPGSINGINTANTGSSVIHEIRTSSPIGNTQQIEYFACFEKIVIFLANGNVLDNQ